MANPETKITETWLSYPEFFQDRARRGLTEAEIQDCFFLFL